MRNLADPPTTEAANRLEQHIPLDTLFRNIGDLCNRDLVEQAVKRAVHDVLNIMPTLWPQLSPWYQKRIQDISTGRSQALFEVAAEYVTQEAFYLKIHRYFNLAKVTHLAQRSPDGALVLTTNNSLVIVSKVSDPHDSSRCHDVEYVPIPCREGTLDTVSYPGKPLARDVVTHQRFAFTPGDVREGTGTSPIRGILQIPCTLPEEQIHTICHSVRTATEASTCLSSYYEDDDE